MTERFRSIDRVKWFAGTFAGTGLLPAAPGTWGSLVALIVIYPIAIRYGSAGVFTLALLASLLTLWSADACERRWGADPPEVVTDEVAGQALTFLFTPFSGLITTDLFILLAGFLLFRFFDILKPLGIKQLQHFRSGLGILLDDLAAGLYALLCLQLGSGLLSLL